jgi:predicted RNA-binding Zn-ribbon protein involved in translation (DUF1610 family)
MFCPFCGSATEERGGALVCPVGNMPFSPHMAAVLSAAFVERTATPSAQPLRFRMGGRWYCPRCGGRMITEPHDVRCARCALHLNEFLVELVEMHSHGGTIDPLTGERIYDGGRD